MLLLPVGKAWCLTGTIFTIWKDKNEAARIRVQRKFTRWIFVPLYTASLWGTQRFASRRFHLHRSEKGKKPSKFSKLPYNLDLVTPPLLSLIVFFQRFDINTFFVLGLSIIL